MDMISELPKDILQRILYFLSQKEAVQTSVLSKSWRYNWCTRPNLDFSFMDFDRENQTFISVVDRTLHRYCDRRLSVEQFDLCILTDNASRFGKANTNCCKSVSLLEKWIPLLTNMGLKKFRLSIYSDDYRLGHLQLPRVVFGAEFLQDLHLKRFLLDRMDVGRILLCKHLRSLCLKQVYIEDEGEEILQKIISSYPLIETLDIQVFCQRLGTLKLNDLHNLKYLSLDVNKDTSHELCSIEICPSSLETLYIDIFGCSIYFNKEADFHFHNLSVLYLCGVNSSLEHLSSCKFPRLKSLTLCGGDGLKEIHLFIDAPNITYFKYKGYFIPSISFATTTSSEWRSQIDLTGWNPDGGSLRFLKLNELLESLSRSEVTLNINYYLKNDRVLIREINGCNKPAAVENLSLGLCFDVSSISSFLNVLFCVCRPRIIDDSRYYGNIWKIIECVWNILMHRESNGDKDDQLWKRDLEEVRFEIKNKLNPQEEWRTVTLSELPNFEGGEQICTRFALKWRQT